MKLLRCYTVLDAGMVLSPATVLGGLMVPLLARLSTHLKPSILSTIVFIGIALSMLALTTINLDITNTRLVLLRIFTTIGVSFIFVPIQILAFAGIASQDMGSASAIINLMRNIGDRKSTRLNSSH